MTMSRPSLWMPIEERIQFKIILLTYKSLNGMAPTYLEYIISLYLHLNYGTQYQLTLSIRQTLTFLN